MNKEFLDECRGKRGWYLHSRGGRIWLCEPSIKVLLHEYLHFVGYSLNFCKKWHWLIETIL